MPTVTHSVPTEATRAGDLARQLARLVGPAVQAPDTSVAAQEYLALGGALATARQTTLDALAEAFPQTADDTLPEWEAALVIPATVGATTATRRSALLARLRAIGGSPQRAERAASTLAGATVTTAEYLWSDVLLSPRRVFRFTVVVPAALVDDVEFRAQLHELLERLAPAHCMWQVVSAAEFLFSTAGAGFGTPFAPVAP